MSRIKPCLWFDRQAEEAAEFYVSIFPDARIEARNRSPVDWPGGKAGDVVLVEIVLAGQRCQALNGGPHAEFNEAISLSATCGDQSEVDRLWSALLAGGGEPMRCGWLKDKYGVRWQIVPEEFETMMRDEDAERSRRLMSAMLEMVKLDVAELRRAYRG